MKGLKTSDVGYFLTGHIEPSYEPGLRACPICGEVVTVSNMHTVSVSPRGYARASAFFRLHATCDAGLSHAQKEDLAERAVVLGNCRGASA
jgi:hypothetical protein